MTRLNTKVPYDFTIGDAIVLDSLYDDLVRALVDKIERLSYDSNGSDAPDHLAAHIVKHRINIITFNYDTFLDRSLWQSTQTNQANGLWSPEDGYGFSCKHAERMLVEYERWVTPSVTWLLKMRGSINWFAKLGSPQPLSIDDVTHLENWFKPHRKKQTNDSPEESQIRRHLERRPFIVPPLLNKAGKRSRSSRRERGWPTPRARTAA